MTDQEMSDAADFLLGDAPLDPELVPYQFIDSGLNWPVIKHPLVFSVPHSPSLNGHVNALLHQKKRQLHAAANRHDAQTYIFLHERPHRVDAFCETIGWHTNPGTYWRTLGQVWVDCENISENFDLWEELLRSDRPGREMFSTAADIAIFNRMSTALTVYRGTTETYPDGWSWTISKDKAEWFANRFGQEGHVIHGKIDKRQAIGYIAKRGESEVVVDPAFVKNWGIS